jgi:hypothetical protein
VTLDQLGDVQSAAPLAMRTGDLQHGQSVGDLFQGDRAAAAHRRRFFFFARTMLGSPIGFGAG